MKTKAGVSFLCTLFCNRTNDQQMKFFFGFFCRILYLPITSCKNDNRWNLSSNSFVGYCTYPLYYSKAKFILIRVFKFIKHQTVHCTICTLSVPINNLNTFHTNVNPLLHRTKPVDGSKSISGWIFLI